MQIQNIMLLNGQNLNSHVQQKSRMSTSYISYWSFCKQTLKPCVNNRPLQSTGHFASAIEIHSAKLRCLHKLFVIQPEEMSL